MQTLRRNLLFSLRQFRRQATLSAAIILTLRLAVGANAAVFSFVNALCGTYEFRRPYNFSGPGRPEECVSRLDPAITLRQE